MAPTLHCLEKEKDTICFHTRPPWPQLGPCYFWNDPIAGLWVHIIDLPIKNRKNKVGFGLFFLLSRVENASGLRLCNRGEKLFSNDYHSFRQPCAARENDADLCVFPVETTVDDKPPTASQETEQPSVPVHTGKFCSATPFLL